jgi:vacuolar-type H+-ATPase subunit I/STV1
MALSCTSIGDSERVHFQKSDNSGAHEMSEQEIGALLDEIQEVKDSWEDEDGASPNVTPLESALNERIAQLQAWLDRIEKAIFAVDAMIEAQEEADGANDDEVGRLEELREKLEAHQAELEENENSLQGIKDELYS